ncbi:Ni/Fe-hydrogenase subunit HybB-like protein [Desulfohalotomaculum tongense]|uniref:NrfD/PsrC family molybdoenzyme membrane anchor subunit n=1 Tax=Desulforadius tongensis TaxID=1216062 RepID=UPI00195A09B3|nr:Ni/Fe-hydrogenase cytochrome b subunit [Desulforadius tongensis]MBM7854836.1 Ni/Fe-hydrogenase subunit HybB-like protein [Desulforadius tongensis]
MAATNTQSWSFRLTPTRVLLFILAGMAAAIALWRLIVGLGPTTNLNDQWPWGLWIGFDVLTGVALAGGGYSTALIVHILHINKFNEIGRSAMLTSMLGYLLVMAGLFLDIGQWFNFWRPFVSWGYHSVLFEVFWCVSLYTTIQVIEFGEILTERVAKPWHKFFRKIMPFLLIVGVLLPTMHQSSLGGLYLIEVGKLHPLWWSPFIPLFFLMSSFFVGPAMVAVETSLAGRAYNHQVDLKVLRGLAKIGGTLMVIYLALKAIDFSNRDAWQYVFAGGLESNMFLLETIGGVIIPLIILISPWGKTRSGLVTYGALTALGVVVNRLNVVITGMVNYYGPGYIPAWTEIVVSAGLVAGGILAYCFIVENFNILGHHEEHEAA